LTSGDGLKTVYVQFRNGVELISQYSDTIILDVLDYYDLTVGVSGSGNTSPSVGVHTYVDGTDVAVTASAGSGWSFSYWLLDSVNVGSANPYTVTMDDDYSLTAVLTEIPPDYYDLTVGVSGSGNTSPTSPPTTSPSPSPLASPTAQPTSTPEPTIGLFLPIEAIFGIGAIFIIAVIVIFIMLRKRK
jgi:hypothetical protein